MNPIQKQYLKMYVDTLAYFFLLEDYDGDPSKYLNAISNMNDEQVKELLSKYEKIAQNVIAATADMEEVKKL